tara:strand:- start:374 stop:697 length:324 start_codon:yes stop_codon:yes gene_type:complete
MSKGLGRNKQGNSEDHDKIGKGIRRAGIKVAAGPAQGNPMPSPKPPAWPTNPKGERKYMNKGGPVKKKRKGYKHGGMVGTPKVNVMTNKPVEVARTTAGSLKRAGIT